MPESLAMVGAGSAPRWGKVIDHTRCIGCHACTIACKSENEVPLSVNRTYVKYVDVGFFPEVRRSFQVTRCNQCEDPPCAIACPTSAMFQRPDGIVDFDKSICIGCKACIAACPYDAIFINPWDHSAEKCNFCAHRVDVGLEPACVVVCPTQAILVGDILDPRSGVSRVVYRHPVSVRRPEKDTRPKLYYSGAHQATLDPLAATRPGGGLFLWGEQGRLPHQVPSGQSGHASSSVAAVLSYDVPHRAPWDWRVSLYTWTKSIAAGAYLALLALALLGLVSWQGLTWLWGAPALAGLFLAVTGGLLIWDLEHPERFYLLFTRPHFTSWLVRGGLIIGAYGALLAAHFLSSVLGLVDPQRWLALPGIALAVMASIYTAYLFAQAKARDLWQNPLLPPHLLVQALMAGSGAAAVLAAIVDPTATPALTRFFACASLAHLLMVLGECTLAHGTAHAHLALREMTVGTYSMFFWWSIALVTVGLLAPWWGVMAVLSGMAGLLAFEHAYVQSGQAVPLA